LWLCFFIAYYFWGRMFRGDTSLVNIENMFRFIM
jgi:hypothetical protein